jgi:hypothetical protein
MRHLDGFFILVATQTHKEIQEDLFINNNDQNKQDTNEDVETNEDTTNISIKASTLIDRALTMLSLQPLTRSKINVTQSFPVSQFYNITSLKYNPPNTTSSTSNSTSNQFNVSNHQLKDVLDTPTTYEQAFYHNNKWCQKLWQKAIKTALD